ncbi:hypothetical protein SAMN05216489_04821 [Streptomyces sp. 3213]|uniref:hypothetical protein n=1 Tax=Streptomyces sp. 3213.3 TaxID=1855348 RepID=UPI000894FB00|nr:hypothetical protein [Streptomyces sp. 3213.3]SED89395.1 hypothetical protein SAMN05216489_04821 [Streptomyces sp. 3213] [Streptomyces sp. 3213.3]
MSDNVDGNGARARREPEVRRGPTWARKEEPNESHAGNGIVNHGPDEQSPTGPSLDGNSGGASGGENPKSPKYPENAENSDSTENPETVEGRAPEGSGGLGGFAGLAAQLGGLGDHDTEGFAPDELALRRLLHQAVQEVEPRDGTLEHLRKAVPARRARKRQAVVGMAAAALFFGTAIPALVHVSNSTGSVDPSMAGNSSQAQGGTSQGKNPDGGSSTSGGSSGQTSGQNPGGHKSEGGSKNQGPGTASANPTSSTGTAAPICEAAQLGSATSSVAAADAGGIVYGTFTVTNTSGTSCTVGGPGTVGFSPLGAAESSKIAVQRHAAGDPAAGLPDPSTEPAELVLLPGSAYQVKFAWVPSETCPTSSGGDSGGTTSGGTTASPSPTEDASTTSGSTAGDTGTSAQLLPEDGMLDGSVQVSHTAQAGSPTTSVVVPNACAGTIYRTGLLPGS